MAGENDQTRWIGIRPTNPAENIPTTESAPLTSILVSPLVPGTQFKTLTQKLAPAIGDLQAPSDTVRIQSTIANVGVNPYEHAVYQVPVGKMFMLNFLTCNCAQATPTSVTMNLVKGANYYPFYSSAYGGAWETHTLFENVLYDEAEWVVVKWFNIGVTDDVWAAMFGYLMDKY